MSAASRSRSVDQVAGIATHHHEVSAGSIAPLTEVRVSPWIRWVALLLLVAMVAIPLASLFVPWQQYVLATGQVVAYGPTDRPQILEAPISGRVVSVHVIENQVVEKGDLLMDLQDIDSERLQLLETQLTQAEAALAAEKRNISTRDVQIDIYIAERSFRVASLEARVESARQTLVAAREKQRGAQRQYDYAKAEYEAILGLSERARAKLQVAKATAELGKAEADVKSAAAAVASAEAGVLEAENALGSGRESVNARIEEARSKRQDSEGKCAQLEAKVQVLMGELRKQRTQDVRAPKAGRVFRILVNPTANVVKQGSPLVEIVPLKVRKAVAVYAKGVDAPLIEVGRRVRLQFEGWPAVQFVGLGARVAAGTFGGIVDQIDARDSGHGRFRLLVVQDPDDEPWPGDRWLRQGVRAKGWVLLETVPLWYEAWRQLNGFPPLVEAGGSEPKSDGNPAKVRSK